MFEHKKIFILGMAKSGYEAAKLLAKYDNQVLITDMKEQDPDNVADLKELGVSFIISDDPEPLLDNTYDYLIKNPGISQDHKCVKKALKLKIPVINEVEMAYDFLKKKNNIIIGVTGSNGKTTTVTIIYELLKSAGMKVHLGGNIGYPVSSLVEKVQDKDILVLEISDHQLHDMYKFKTNISVLTNLSETHLDFNKTYDNYKQIKKRIFNNHTNLDIAIINMDNDDSVNLTKDIKSNKIYFSAQNITDVCIKDNSIYYHDEEVIPLDMIRIQGKHNYENIMCSIAVVKQFGVSNDVIKQVLNDFSGVEHRLEYVDKINGREFYNDSKSTNNQSTITALQSFKTPVILIMGGYDRNMSFDSIAPFMDNVKHVVCYGQTKDKIADFCNKYQKDCVVINTLEEAVRVAYNLSDREDTILLSPACASQDQFKNFEERGKCFKQYVDELKEEESKNEDF